MPERIACTVITGFLGAGKTTLIQSLLRDPKGRRLALIVNEFGDAGVDGDLVKSCGFEDCDEDDVLELANGCICCTVADDFLPTLTRLLERETPPDHIVIETSGLALPQPLLRAFAWPEVRSRVTVDGVVTVIDAQAVADGGFAADETAVNRQRKADDSLDHDSPLAELFEDQLSCADLVVLSKSDLVSDEARARAEATVVQHKRAAANIVQSGSVKPPIDVLLGVAASAEDDAANRRSHHERHHDAHNGVADHDHDHAHPEAHDHDHDHDAFESFTVPVHDVRDAAFIAERVADAGRIPGVLRIKGFVPVTGKPMRLVVQAVGPRVAHYFDRPWQPHEDRAGQLVVIGLAGMARDRISTALRGETA